MKKIALFLIAIIALVACDGNEQTGGKIESLTLNPNQLELKIGAEKKIRTVVQPATDEIYTVVWESSDDAVATVDNNGNVVAIAAGTATITATIEGTNISATAAVTVVSPFDALSFYTLSLMGSGKDPYHIEGVDANEDGINDDIYMCMFYALPQSMYMQDNSLMGEDDYIMVIYSACSVCPLAEDTTKKAIYSLGAYAFTDDEEVYLAECTDGEKRLVPHYASYSHFNEEKYLGAYTVFYDVLNETYASNGGDADAAYEAANTAASAYVKEHGYWMGDYDSYVSYVAFEEGISDAGFIVGGAGVECGREAASYDLDYYDVTLRMFETRQWLVTEPYEDPETGETVTIIKTPLELAPTVEKTYTYGEPRTQEPAEVQSRAMEYKPVSFEAAKKQIAVNNALFASLKVAFAKK